MPIPFKITLVKVGNSLRMTIPSEIVGYKKLRAGDVVYVSVVNDLLVVKLPAKKKP